MGLGCSRLRPRLVLKNRPISLEGMRLACLSILALTAPLLAWDDDDGFKKPDLNRRSSLNDYGYNKKTEDYSYGYQQRNSLKVESI